MPGVRCGCGRLDAIEAIYLSDFREDTVFVQVKLILFYHGSPLLNPNTELMVYNGEFLCSPGPDGNFVKIWMQ